MQQYYLHNEYINNGMRKNAKPVKIHNKPLLCMSNENVLEFYEQTSNGIRYYSKHSFNCNIERLEVLPTKQHFTEDYLFIVDKKGRYGFWHYESGFQLVENNQIALSNSLYKNDQSSQTVSFSGQIHHFDVFDTKGSIFFTNNHTIVFIDYTINRMGLKILKTKEMLLPYVQYRYVNWITSKKSKLLGIIDEIEEKTILKIHNLDHLNAISVENLVYEREKVNMSEFISQGEEILLVADEEITTVLQSKNYQDQFHYKVHNATSGRVVHLFEETYCFIGQELIVFTKGKLKAFGSLSIDDLNILDKKGILSATYLAKTDDGGYMICVSTLNNELYFIILYENAWKLYYHLKALTSIYSIHPTGNCNSILAVMDESTDEYQIVIVQKQSSVPLIKQQICQNPIDKLMSIQQGKYITVSSRQSSSLMKYNQDTLEFDLVSEFQAENLQLIANNIMITDHAIYAVSIEDSYCEEIAQEEVILSTSNQSRVLYMNSSGVIMMISIELNDIQIVRENASDEYIWHLLPNSDLITAKTSDLLSLYIYRQSEMVSQIALEENCLISSIHHFSFENEILIEELIVVGFMNGHIHLYATNGELKEKFSDYCSEPVTFFPINSNLLGVVSRSRQLILSMKKNNLSITPIQFSKSGNNISSVVYLKTTNQFIFVQNDEIESGKLIRMVSLNDVYNGMETTINTHDSYRIQTICEHLNEIPTVFIHQRTVFVGLNSALMIYDLDSGRLLKTQTNYLKDVLGIFILECGLVVYGIDSIERNLIYLYSLQDYEQICFINHILKDNKYIKTIKEIPDSNKFICRGETFTTVCELICPKEIVELLQFKTDLTGYALEIDTEYKLFAETDSKRLLILFTYENNILPLARYIAPTEINDLLVFHRCLIIGDKEGCIHILEMNTEDENQALRMALTKVASINVGQEVTTLAKRSDHEIYYGTVSGKIGVIQVISEEEHNGLKPVEQQIFKQLESKCDFNYSSWRARNSSEDKLIDGALIKRYLQQSQRRNLGQRDRLAFQQTSSLYERLII